MAPGDELRLRVGCDEPRLVRVGGRNGRGRRPLLDGALGAAERRSPARLGPAGLDGVVLELQDRAVPGGARRARRRLARADCAAQPARLGEPHGVRPHERGRRHDVARHAEGRPLGRVCVAARRGGRRSRLLGDPGERLRGRRLRHERDATDHRLRGQDGPEYHQGRIKARAGHERERGGAWLGRIVDVVRHEDGRR